MIRRWLRAGLLLALAAPASLASAEQIRRFDVEIALAGDDSFTVTETIDYDFGNERRRGIYREIRIAYGRGQAADYHIALELESVTDAAGNPRPTAVTSSGGLRRIRIGDPDRQVSGVQTYRIRYRVRRGLLWFDSHDELYWNVTGNDWKIPVAGAAATVRLPEGVRADDVRSACFTGPQGAIESACSLSTRADRLRVVADRSMGPGEGLTLVVGLAKGILSEPTSWQKTRERLSDYVSVWSLLPFATLAAMLYLWRRHGRDPASRAAVPVRYEPPEGLTPAEVGTLLDEKADIDDITATILDLAVRGYLEIEELPSSFFLFLSNRDYQLRRLRHLDAGAREHEKELVGGLFSGSDRVKISGLKNKFHTRLPEIRKALYHQLSRQHGFFPASPDRVRHFWRVGGFVVMGLAFVCLSLQLLAVRSALPVVLAGGIVVLFSGAMPRRTRKGRRAYEEILGFREFLTRVDADRLERSGGRSAGRFEQVLPYAVVLGVADQWADAFADVYTEPPSWYHGTGRGHFAPREFVSDLGHGLSTVGQTLQSKPSGSGSSGLGGGGGFSGGGFGGGGGGSW